MSDLKPGFVSVRLVDGSEVSIPPYAVDGFRGLSEDGYVVIADSFLSQPGDEYLIGLTPCCFASAKGLESYIGCRSCYREIDPALGGRMSVHVARA